MKFRQLFTGTFAVALALSAAAFDPKACRIPERFKDHPLFTTRHCSVNFGFLSRRGYFSRPEILAQAAKIKAAGANWVTLNTHFCQEAFYSRRMFLDFDWSASESELSAIVKELHKQGLHILFKPCLTTLDSSWMGSVTFPGKKQQQIQGVTNTYWVDWFNSLRQCLVYFSEFATRHNIEAMIIGAEYNGTIREGDEWRKTIATVRKHFHGPISYEFMDSQVVPEGDYTCTTVDRFKTHRFMWMKDLDFLAVSTYPRAAPYTAPSKWATLDPIPFETMMKHLAHRRKFISDLSARFDNMPVIFTEVGTRSCRGCCVIPGNYLQDSPRDEDEQANYMEAIFTTFSDLPCWLGLSWWKWDETQRNRPHYSDDRSKDRGFIIDGKRACEVLRKWSQKEF